MRVAAIVIALMLLAPGAVAAEEAAKPDEVPQAVRPAAEIRAENLDKLFAKLHGAADPNQAQEIEQGIWKIWMSADSPTAEVLIQQAALAMNQGAPEQSLKILNRLIGAYPDFPEAWNKRATLYFMMHKYTESLADIDKVLELEPRHFGALSGRGMIYQRQNKFSAALDSYRDALALNPGMESVKDAIEQIEKLEQGI
jgi:tetratricopeptide (TPR) repeat protein